MYIMYIFKMSPKRVTLQTPNPQISQRITHAGFIRPNSIAPETHKRPENGHQYTPIPHRQTWHHNTDEHTKTTRPLTQILANLKNSLEIHPPATETLRKTHLPLHRLHARDLPNTRTGQPTGLTPTRDYDEEEVIQASGALLR